MIVEAWANARTLGIEIPLYTAACSILQADAVSVARLKGTAADIPGTFNVTPISSPSCGTAAQTIH